MSSIATFHEYLTEAQNAHSVFSSIAENWSTPPIFFTPTVMKRLQYTLEGVIAFHGTDPKGLRGIVSKQGKKSTQISVVSGARPSALRTINGGVETAGGVLVELQGDIAMSFNRDAYTGRVKGGRRTIQIESDWSENRSGFYDVYKNMYGDTIIELGNDLIKNAIVPAMTEFENPVRMAERETIEKVGPASPFLNTYSKFLEAIREKRPKGMFETKGDAMDMVQLIHFLKSSPVPRNPVSELDKQQVIADKYLRPAAGKFVRAYMDGMEKVLRNETYRQMFAEMGTGISYGYDEAIMGNFTILSVHIDRGRWFSDIQEWKIEKKKIIEEYGIKRVYTFNSATSEGITYLENLSQKTSNNKNSLANNLLADWPINF